MKRSTPILTISVLLALTAGLTAAAQTGTEQPPAPAWTAEETVCPWDNVNDNPRLARVCLQATGVNTGLAEYAFVEEPFDYDPDEPTPSGTPEEAGLVSRWAMGEAIHRMIETAVEEAGGQTPALPDNHRSVFTDIGWLGEDTRRKLDLLFHWGITTGTNVYGEYSPTQTVTRAQMARFFVRSLAAIDRFTEGDGTPRFEADNTWQTLGRNTDAFEIPAPFADVQAGKPPAGILDRGLLGAVSILYDLGITRGAGSDADGNPVYRPELNVSGDQMARFLVRLLAHTSVRVTDATPDLTAAELPEIQQEEPPIRAGGRGFPADFLSRRLDQQTLLTPDPSTRPPREFNFYKYKVQTYGIFSDLHEQIEIYDGGQIARTSERFSLQIGDWYWTRPPGVEEREIGVLVLFRAEAGYIPDYYPDTRAYFCYFKDAPSAGERGELGTFNVFRVSPGTFRMLTRNAWDPDKGNDCGIAGVPSPAGGYTDEYPCVDENHFTKAVFKSWPEKDRWGELRSCRN